MEERLHRRKGIEWETNEQGCHLVTSHRIHNGYAYIKREGKSWRLHRWLWTQEYGPIPEGMVLMHSCDNPRCINLSHLSIGTQGDNVADKMQKGRGGYITKPIIKNNIRKIRNEKGITLKVLAIEVGVSEAYLNRIENGKRAGSLQIMKDVAIKLGVSLDTLLEDD